MNKIAFALSGALVLISICTLIATGIIKSVVPKLGLVAFQAAAAGSFSEADYEINFIGINYFSVILMLLGVAMCIFFLIKNTKS